MRALLILSVLFARVATVPLDLRDVNPAGPQGNLSNIEHWRDAVGTATQIFDGGPVAKNSVFHTLRTGPMSSVYRSMLHANASASCNSDSGMKCEVAIDGFGSSGETHYVFDDSAVNVEGRSTQVMVACRCLGSECGDAVLIRPVSISRWDAEIGDYVDSGEDTCLYEAVEGKFSDCHSELLRLSQRPRDALPAYLREPGAFVYSVLQPQSSASWTARGQRGWTHECPNTDVEALPTANIGALTATDVKPNVHTTSALDPHCQPRGNVQYFRDQDEEGGRACSALYAHAAVGASHRASQQDDIAVGKWDSSYFESKPGLVSNTELALSCSAAALGLLFVWSAFRKQRKKQNVTILYTVWLVFIQIVAYLLEALPLHTALITEVGARRWASQFAFVDGTVALAQDQTGPQGSVAGSVLILTAVVGDVMFKWTRVGLIGFLTGVFDLVAVLIVAATIGLKVRMRQRQKTGEAFQTSSSSPKSSSKELPKFLARWEKATRKHGKATNRRRRRGVGLRLSMMRGESVGAKNTIEHDDSGTTEVSIDVDTDATSEFSEACSQWVVGEMEKGEGSEGWHRKSCGSPTGTSNDAQ